MLYWEYRNGKISSQVQLSEYCVRSCKILNIYIHGFSLSRISVAEGKEREKYMRRKSIINLLYVFIDKRNTYYQDGDIFIDMCHVSYFSVHRSIKNVNYKHSGGQYFPLKCIAECMKSPKLKSLITDTS